MYPVKGSGSCAGMFKDRSAPENFEILRLRRALPLRLVRILYYGLTRHVMAGVGLSAIYWHSNNPDPEGQTSGAGIGTTSLLLKYRPIVQDPDSWKPSVALYSKLSLPTNRWVGTPEIPGGFTPLSRVPSSRFGAVAVTEGLLFRKNLKPFRISGNVFYSYNLPGSGSEPGATVYGGDLITTARGARTCCERTDRLRLFAGTHHVD